MDQFLEEGVAVEYPSMLQKTFPMVGDDDEERLLREAHVSKQLEDLSHVVVRVRYLAVVEGDEMGQVPRRDPGFNSACWRSRMLRPFSLPL